MQLIHIVGNDFVFFILTFFVDMLLIVRIRKNLEKKKGMIMKETTEKVKSRKLKDIKKARNDTNNWSLSILASFLYAGCLSSSLKCLWFLSIMKKPPSDNYA